MACAGTSLLDRHCAEGDLSRDRYSAHGRFSLLEKLDGSVVVSPDGFVVVMRRRVGDGFEHPVGCRR